MYNCITTHHAEQQQGVFPSCKTKNKVSVTKLILQHGTIALFTRQFECSRGISMEHPHSLLCSESTRKLLATSVDNQAMQLTGLLKMANLRSRRFRRGSALGSCTFQYIFVALKNIPLFINRRQRHQNHHNELHSHTLRSEGTNRMTTFLPSSSSSSSDALPLWLSSSSASLRSKRKEDLRTRTSEVPGYLAHFELQQQ